MLDFVWNVMANAQKKDFVFRRKGRVLLHRRGRQFSRLLTAELCVSAVGMLDTPCSEVVWRVLATQSIRQFPLHIPSRASPCAIRFQLETTNRFLVRRTTECLTQEIPIIFYRFLRPHPNFLSYIFPLLLLIAVVICNTCNTATGYTPNCS